MSKPRKRKPKKKEPPIDREGAFLEPSTEYQRGITEMRNIGMTFRLNPEFRDWLRDIVYDLTRLAKDVCWKVVEAEATGDVTGSSFGSKQDVLYLANAILYNLLPPLPDLYKLWWDWNSGRFSHIGTRPESAGDNPS